MTLLFLVKKTDDKIAEVCLAMKKRGFGVNRWNGVGGKIEAGESIEEAMIRETKEEIEVNVTDSYKEKVGEITFTFKYTPEFNQFVNIYVTEKWEGEPMESEEMAPKWISVDEIPYKDMWPDDIFWLPHVLNGEKLKGEFYFGEKDSILEQKIELVKEFN